MRVRLVNPPGMTDGEWTAMMDGRRVERRIAGWLEAQPRRVGVDLAVTCSIQCAVSQEEAAAILRRWSDRR